MAGKYGPNSEQVDWVLGRLRQLTVGEWRTLASSPSDEDEEAIQEAIAEVRRRGPAETIDRLREVAVEVAETAVAASQELRGDLEVLDIPVVGTGWTGEVEGTLHQPLAPEDRFPFRQAARNVLWLAFVRPFGTQQGFARLWAPFEPVMRLLDAERQGSVQGPPHEIIRPPLASSDARR